MEQPTLVEVDIEEIEGLVDRAKHRLRPEDVELLKGLVQTLLMTISLVQKGRANLARLRRLFGLVSSEKTAKVREGMDQERRQGDGKEEDAGTSSRSSSGGTTDARGADGKTTRKGHGRNPASAYPEACQLAVLHEQLSPGQRCPACQRGSLYELQDPARFLRIVGQPPLAAWCWNCQRLRCNGCGMVFTAEPPEEAKGAKHDETAAAMICLLHYGAGTPFHRLETLQRNLSTPLPSSTQWDVVESRSEDLLPAYDALCRTAAQDNVIHNDDTFVRVLAFMGKRRAKLLRHGRLPSPDRTGLFTTGIVTVGEDGRLIALFFTGRRHAGENLATLLEERGEGLDPPILMCDGLDRNIPKEHEVIESNCNSHGRRHFVDAASSFPSESLYVLECLGQVFKVEELCRAEGLSSGERLARHQRDSAPIMAALKAWLDKQTDEKLVEPNSVLGEAISYMTKRWDKLTRFLYVPGAPLHNNAVERILKKAILHRRNSLFYRTQHGATVGDLYMALIHTAELNGENPLHYLTQLMRHPKAVAQDPDRWLPWTYRQTLAADPLLA